MTDKINNRLDKNIFCNVKNCDIKTGLRRCGRCQTAFYCSQEHQKLDWRSHKPICRAPNLPTATATAKLSTTSNNSKNNIVVMGGKNLSQTQQQQQLLTQHMSNEGTKTSVEKIVGETDENNGKNFVRATNIVTPTITDDNFDFREKDKEKTSSFKENQLKSILSPNNTMHINGNSLNLINLNLNYSEISEQFRIEEMCSNLIRDMNEYGVCVLDNFLGHERGMEVLSEVINMYSAGVFEDGQLVSNKGEKDKKHIRSDKITWIGGKEAGCTNIEYLINQVDNVVCIANRMQNNGKLCNYNIKERTKAMVACYPGSGSHYVKHVDNPNRDGRCITAIYYLNMDWDVRRSGGLLRIFPEGWTDKVADIEPIFDRILFFWSDRRNPHEVQPAHRTRYAITLWYLDAIERESALHRYQNDRENKLKTC